MIAFLLVTLVPAIVLFALVAVVLLGLMLESVKRPAVAAPALDNAAISPGDHTDVGFEKALVPSAA